MFCLLEWSVGRAVGKRVMWRGEISALIFVAQPHSARSHNILHWKQISCSVTQNNLKIKASFNWAVFRWKNCSFGLKKILVPESICLSFFLFTQVFLLADNRISDLILALMSNNNVRKVRLEGRWEDTVE